MGGDIAVIVVGGLCALCAALFEGVRLPDWLWGGNLESRRVLFEALITAGFVLPTFATVDLTAGHPLWARLVWIVVAFLGGALFYALPHSLRKSRLS